MRSVLRGIRSGPRQRDAQAAEARPAPSRLRYRVVGDRDLSYGLVERRQVWVLVPPDSGLFGDSRSIVDAVLRFQLRYHPGMNALCVAFYTALDLRACLGCWEWAPAGDWNCAALVARGNHVTHRWTVLDDPSKEITNCIKGT